MKLCNHNHREICFDDNDDWVCPLCLKMTVIKSLENQLNDQAISNGKLIVSKVVKWFYLQERGEVQIWVTKRLATHAWVRRKKMKPWKFYKLCPAWRYHVKRSWNFQTWTRHWFCRYCPLIQFMSCGKAYRLTVYRANLDDSTPPNPPEGRWRLCSKGLDTRIGIPIADA